MSTVRGQLNMFSTPPPPCKLVIYPSLQQTPISTYIKPFKDQKQIQIKVHLATFYVWISHIRFAAIQLTCKSYISVLNQPYAFACKTEHKKACAMSV